MQKRPLHIVFGRCAQGTLLHSQALDMDEIRLVCLEDNLASGPVCDLHSDEDAERRKTWLRSIYGDIPDELDVRCDPVEKDIETIISLIKNPDDFDEVYLWTGPCVDEMIATSRLMFHLAQLGKAVFIVDFPNIRIVNKIGRVIYPDSLIVTDPAQVHEIAEHFRPITEKDFTDWKRIWENVMSGNSLLRVLGKDGEIRHEDITYYDSFLESNSTDEFQKSARVIGETLCDINFGIGDGFLNWRLKQMCLSGKLEWRGELKEMRYYEVRKRQN